MGYYGILWDMSEFQMSGEDQPSHQMLNSASHPGAFRCQFMFQKNQLRPPNTQNDNFHSILNEIQILS